MTQTRWDYTTSQSKWHFNTHASSEPGVDNFIHVCRFNADFPEACTLAEGGLKPNNWSTGVLRPWLKNQEVGPDQADLVRAGADPNGEIYDRAPADHVPLFCAISDYLGMEKPIIKYHVQRTGQYVVTHIDDFFQTGFNRWNWLERNRGEPLTEPRDVKIRRFAIMLDDWKLGQIFQVGTANWHQWRAGDCITWDWYNTPHSTANLGWAPRHMLQITGAETLRTQEVLAQANINKIIDIKELL